MARRAETNIADCGALHMAWKSICMSELAGQAIQGLVGNILRPVHFIPPEVYVLKYAKVINLMNIDIVAGSTYVCL